MVASSGRLVEFPAHTVSLHGMFWRGSFVLHLSSLFILCSEVGSFLCGSYGVVLLLTLSEADSDFMA